MNMNNKFVEVAKIQKDSDWVSTHISIEFNLEHRMLCKAWVKAFCALMATLREHRWILALNDLEEYSIVNEGLDDLPVLVKRVEYTMCDNDPKPQVIFSLPFKDLMRLEIKLVGYLQKNPL